MLLVIGQCEEVFGQGIVTSFGKPANQQDDELVPQRIIFSELDGLFLRESNGQCLLNIK